MAPILVCLAIYWYGLKSWFQMDDFAWLGLHTRIVDLPSFLAAMFQPLAQGTIRPWSERLYFLLGWEVARMESAWLLRGIAFLTQFGNLILLSAIARRLTGGSLVAGVAAPVLWLCNANLYIPMAWSSAYNQVLCGFFLLLALWLWIRYTDTEDARYYWLQFGVFVLGFGALEINVVYPALALLFAVCFGRSQFAMQTVPMFGVSTIYAVVHRLSAPASRDDVYGMYFDTSVFQTLWQYLRLAMGAERYASWKHWNVPAFQAAAAIAGVALLIFVVWMLIRRQWMAAFGLGWFLVVLAPVLLLKNHITDYYLFLPVIGLAMLGGWGLSLAFQRSRLVGALVLALTLVYALPSAVMARGMTIRYYIVARRARAFVRSVAAADRLHPRKTIVVRHMDDDLFWAAWWDGPFRLFGRSKIFVAAEDEPHIIPVKGMDKLSRFFLSEREQLAGLQAGSVVVYELLPDGKLRNVSELRREVLAREEGLSVPRFLSFGAPESAAFLRDGWWEPESNFRWSSSRAEFTIHGPLSAGGELAISGMCPEQHMAKGPLKVSVSVEGQRVGGSTIGPENLKFELRYPLPASLAGRPSVVVAIEVDRVLQVPGDRRTLGLAVGTAEVVR